MKPKIKMRLEAKAGSQSVHIESPWLDGDEMAHSWLTNVLEGAGNVFELAEAKAKRSSDRGGT